MLGAIFRGVFLVSILVWYSTSVWKMIDGYFKDQFRSYLEEEYRKNPRIKSDVERHSTAKVVSTVTAPQPEPTKAPQRNVDEVCELGSCAVEAAESNSLSSEHQRNDEVTGGTGENQAEVSTDKNAFLETTVEPRLESAKPTDGNKRQEPGGSVDHGDRDLEKGKSEPEDRSTSPVRKNSKRRLPKYGKKSMTSEQPAKEKRSSKKRKVKTITLTDNDFATAKKTDVSDDDFWEFEEEKEPVEGILVSTLPFKPRADVGDLERVTADEYCPLTLEDEASCGETFKWP